MKKKDLITKVTELLTSRDERKPMMARSKILHITDSDGNKTDFKIKSSERGILYTQADVEKILEAAFAIIEDSLRHGEEVSIHGFGAFKLAYRAERSTRNPSNGERIVIPAHFVPKFFPGKKLYIATKTYEYTAVDHKMSNRIIDDEDGE